LSQIGEFPAPHAARELRLVARDDAERPALEDYVRGAFAAGHAARISSFMPSLLQLRDRQGATRGVVGYRHAGAEALFLERYLDAPVEALLAARTGRQVARAEVVEVGNLASTSCRTACHLVALLPRYLLERGQRWIVFTATDTVRALLGALGAPLIELAPARVERVATPGDDWGRYYQRDPRVMAGYLPDGLALRQKPGR
jgi:hypothetical protein